MKNDPILSQILKVLISRYKSDYKKSPPDLVINKMKDRISLAYFENRIVFKTDKQEKIRWFFIFEVSFRGDFNQFMYIVSDLYIKAKNNVRDHFELLSHLRKQGRFYKKNQSLKKALINVYVKDTKLKNYFSLNGELTAIELLGKVSDGLHYLKRQKFDKKIRIRTLNKSDIETVIRLDTESHVNDPTSRMRERFKQKDALAFQRPFYHRLVKNKNALCATDGRTILGVIGFFIFKDIKHAMIACIFVNQSFKGQKIGQFLYNKALMKFKKSNCHYYLGTTTTESVLKLAPKFKRKEKGRAYILKL